jgi:peptidoglycan/xylan/chitin deacetylase (PgdA/CDA1 family)
MKGSWRIKQASRKLRRHFRPGAIILNYHRIADLTSDPYCVAPNTFAQHLDYIRRMCQPMHLLDMVDAVQQGALPKRAVVITFDDGFVETLYQAYPLLARAQIPATVFVIAGDIDRPPRSWEDWLEQVLFQSKSLPSRLRLSVRGEIHEWSIVGTEQRQRAHGSICQLLQPLTAAEQLDAVHDLAAWAGVCGNDHPSYCAMTSAELCQLTRDGLVELGAHTLTHPILSALPADAQQTEIISGREVLQSVIGRPVLTFAYPHGQETDFTDETARIVKTAGFRLACTTIPGAVERGADLFRLRRYYVGNWNPETFKKNLEWLLIA